MADVDVDADVDLEVEVEVEAEKEKEIKTQEELIEEIYGKKDAEETKEAKGTKEVEEDKVETLRKVFPNFPGGLLKYALEKHHNNVNDATIYLMSDAAEKYLNMHLELYKEE